MAGKRKQYTTEEKIKKEKKRLLSIFSGLGKKKLALLNADIENLAFYTVMCEDLRDRILQNGVAIKYQNGANQHGEKLSPDAETVDKWSLRIDQITGRLLSMVPEEQQPGRLELMMKR